MLQIIVRFLTKLQLFNRRLKGIVFKTFAPRKGFILSNKYIFLTYSQCHYSPAKIAELLIEKAEIDSILITQEKHVRENSRSKHKGLHLHCFIKFASKLRTENSRFFDIVNPLDLIVPYHPNIQRVKNTIQDRKRIEQYCLKDYLDVYVKGDAFIEYETVHSTLTTTTGVIVGKHNLLEACIDLSKEGLIDEAMIVLNTVDLRLFVRRSKNWLNAFHLHYELHNKKEEIKLPKYHIRNFDPKWVNFIYGIFTSDEIKKNLIIHGDSDCGKTQLLKSVTHHFNFKALSVDSSEAFKKNNRSYKVLILDDTRDIKKASREEVLSWISRERDTTVDVKHGSVTLFEGQLRIILTNKKIAFRKDESTLFGKIELTEAIENRFDCIILPKDVTLFASEREVKLLLPRRDITEEEQIQLEQQLEYSFIFSPQNFAEMQNKYCSVKNVEIEEN